MDNAGYEEGCESPVMERPASCADDTHSLSSDSSLSILSPETSLQGHIEPDSLGMDNAGYEEGSCSSSLRKEEGSVILTEYEKSATLELTDGDKKMKNNIRKEKMERRMPKCSKVCNWTIGLVLVAGGTIVAVLIGTGVIIVKRKGLNSSEVFDDVVSKQKHYQPHYKQVPNAFNGKLKITNMEWDTKLEDKSSEIYKTLRNKVENDLVRLFEEISPNSKVNIVVTGFSPGSVVVSYTVGWLSKNIIHSAIDVRKGMVHKLKEGNGKLVGQFIVAKQSIEVKNVLKDCAQLGCKDECHYSYSMLQHYCGCEKGQDCSEEVIDTHQNFSDNQISKVNKNLSENQISDNDEVSQNLVTYSVRSKTSTTPSTIDLNGE